jgi:hypothetical protein
MAASDAQRLRLPPAGSAALVAVVLLTLLLVTPRGAHLTYGFIIVAVGVGLVSFLVPHRVPVHIAGGVVPVVLLLFSIAATRSIHLDVPDRVWHGPSLASRALAVVVLVGIPATVGLLVGDRLGRVRARRSAPSHPGVRDQG